MTELEMDKVRAEIQKLFDDAAKSRAEAQKIITETRWYPFFGLFAAGAAFMGALVAVIKVFM